MKARVRVREKESEEHCAATEAKWKIGQKKFGHTIAPYAYYVVVAI